MTMVSNKNIQISGGLETLMRRIIYTPSLVSDNLLQRAILFSKELPDLHNTKKEWDGIAFEIIADGKLPADKSIYQKENINKHALSAFNKVLHDENIDQLAFRDFRFYFIVYFRHENKILGEMEFTYLMNDKLFL